MLHMVSDWNQQEDFFRFTCGRFVNDEASQLARCYIRFNMNKLADIAARATGATHEVATIDFMRTVLQTPVPQIYAWSSRVDENNPVGAEYTIMEKLSGVPLGVVCVFLKPQDQVKVCMQVANVSKEMIVCGKILSIRESLLF
ncbi:hypothetical protein AJ80_01786 [Polytolypa hystricis UAMH7299]|uniref:Uncharacterized protein n=1 Tax=Polytolypa hystricis (strain UAMH7299) TaxID=1447883 RepID=A0A2B7YZT0_POLH7|nr:hypothetical protein AJ80_01786 [Polytolypa hystricis UAMH7299]